MKLDKMTFAKLVAHCISNGMSAGDYEINELDNIADIIMPNVATDQVNPSRVDDILKAMAGDRKIEAIKAYRALTGSGLKESKDAIEAYWVTPREVKTPKYLDD